MTQEMVRGFSLIEEALLVSEAQEPSVEQCIKDAAAVQNAIQCYHVIYNEKKKKLLPSHHWTIFSSGFSSVQSLSRVRLFVTPWPAALHASLSITNSRSLLKLMSSG